MKNYLWFTVILCLSMAGMGCETKSELPGDCQGFNFDQTFRAKIGETWCHSKPSFQITFGPLIEDSRCNVPNIECVWAGRYVMLATVLHGGDVIAQDTFDAVSNWSDTLYNTPYTIMLQKVYPEIRDSVGNLPDSVYSFDVKISQ